MIKEEKYLVDRFGKKQPFSVPEGYFDQFASQFMENLPEREEEAVVVRLDSHSRWSRLRSRHSLMSPWSDPAAMAPSPSGSTIRRWSVAACLAVALAGAGMWAFQGESPKATGAADASQLASSNYNTAIDQAADYAMMDNGDIYAYVSGY